MENNDSPYIYEKPLRNSDKKRGRGIAALGLVALGAVVGSGAFAQVLEADASTSTQLADGSATVSTAEPTEPDSILLVDGNQVTSATTTSAQNPIVAVPFEQAEPKKDSAAIELPTISNSSYGNTSSATPSAGGTQTGSNLGTYQSRDHEDSDDSSEDRHESQDDHDDDDDDHEEND